MVWYFAYGSNLLKSEILRTIKTEWKQRIKGILRDYKLVFDKYSGSRKGGVSDIVESPSKTVEGALCEISEEQLKALDKREGHPNFYKRTLVMVESELGAVEAITYIVVRKEGFVKPTEYYKNLIIMGLKEMGYGKEAFEKIEKAARGD